MRERVWTAPRASLSIRHDRRGRGSSVPKRPITCSARRSTTRMGLEVQAEAVGAVGVAGEQRMALGVREIGGAHVIGAEMLIAPAEQLVGRKISTGPRAVPEFGSAELRGSLWQERDK